MIRPLGGPGRGLVRAGRAAAPSVRNRELGRAAVFATQADRRGPGRATAAGRGSAASRRRFCLSCGRGRGAGGGWGAARSRARAFVIPDDSAARWAGARGRASGPGGRAIRPESRAESRGGVRNSGRSPRPGPGDRGAVRVGSVAPPVLPELRARAGGRAGGGSRYAPQRALLDQRAARTPRYSTSGLRARRAARPAHTAAGPPTSSGRACRRRASSRCRRRAHARRAARSAGRASSRGRA
jgi:hypothetical protein